MSIGESELSLTELLEKWNDSIQDYHSELVSLMGEDEETVDSQKPNNQILHVPRDFPTIGEAVDQASAGDNWVYRVNGVLGDKSSGLYRVNPGDHVIWGFGKYSAEDSQ